MSSLDTLDTAEFVARPLAWRYIVRNGVFVEKCLKPHAAGRVSHMSHVQKVILRRFCVKGKPG